MIIRIIAIGNKMPSWIQEGFQEYVKRFPLLKLIEIPAEKRSKNANLNKIIEKEGFKIAAAINANIVIALDVKGKTFSTEQLSQTLKTWQDENSTVDIIIGGPDGLAKKCLDGANYIWSLSKLTLPHPLVRIIVAEQLYRAQSILKNHPYHR